MSKCPVRLSCKHATMRCRNVAANMPPRGAEVMCKNPSGADEDLVSFFFSGADEDLVSREVADGGFDFTQLRLQGLGLFFLCLCQLRLQGLGMHTHEGEGACVSSHVSAPPTPPRTRARAHTHSLISIPNARTCSQG